MIGHNQGSHRMHHYCGAGEIYTQFQLGTVYIPRRKGEDSSSWNSRCRRAQLLGEAFKKKFGDWPEHIQTENISASAQPHLAAFVAQGMVDSVQCILHESDVGNDEEIENVDWGEEHDFDL